MKKKQDLMVTHTEDSIKVIIPPENFDPIFYPLVFIWIQLTVIAVLLALKL